MSTLVVAWKPARLCCLWQDAGDPMPAARPFCPRRTTCPIAAVSRGSRPLDSAAAWHGSSHPQHPGRESGLGRVVVWPREGGTPSAGRRGCCHVTMTVGSHEAEGWVLSRGLRRVHACACACVCMPWLRRRPGLLTVLEGRTSRACPVHRPPGVRV